MFYEYKVTYWNEYEEKDFEESGLTWASNYGEAANKIKEDYRDDLIDMYLHEWDTTNTVSLDEIKEGFKLYS